MTDRPKLGLHEQTSEHHVPVTITKVAGLGCCPNCGADLVLAESSEPFHDLSNHCTCGARLTLQPLPAKSFAPKST